jgi:hypothetical protein
MGRTKELIDQQGSTRSLSIEERYCSAVMFVMMSASTMEFYSLLNTSLKRSMLVVGLRLNV